MQVTQRHRRLLEIEARISEVKPDAMECEGIVDALADALRRRYDDPSEVLLRLSLLKGDLERLDVNQQIDAQDVLACYERAVERKVV